jgi:hypothetical protein
MQDSRRIEPYVWDPSVEIPKDVVKLWEDVGIGIDKDQTGTFNMVCHFLRLCWSHDSLRRGLVVSTRQEKLKSFVQVSSN